MLGSNNLLNSAPAEENAARMGALLCCMKEEGGSRQDPAEADKELEACLLADMTELPAGADVLDLLWNDAQKVKRDSDTLERLETLFKAYQKAKNRGEQEEKAGELIEEVLSLLNEANLL